MPKLITPVSFSDKLSVCGKIGQPDITDEVRQAVALPIADLQPAGAKPPAQGKFLQSSNLGTLLKQLAEQGYEQYETLGPFAKTENGIFLATFSRKVYKFVDICTYLIMGCSIAWSTPTGCDIESFTYGLPETHDFVGTKFYYSVKNYIGGTNTFIFYGFY